MIINEREREIHNKIRRNNAYWQLNQFYTLLNIIENIFDDVEVDVEVDVKGTNFLLRMAYLGPD
jgi:hypothetical protein